MTKPE